MATMPKIPTMSLAKRVQDKKSAQLSELIDRRGSTAPLKLEERRNAMTHNVAKLKKFVSELQAEHKAMLADEIEIEKQTVAELAAFEKANTHTLDQLQAIKNMIEQAKQARKNHAKSIHIAAMQFNAQADVIDSNCLLFDVLTVRMIKKSKKSNKVGRFRQAIAMTMYDTNSMLDDLLTKLMPEQYPPEERDKLEYLPEDDDEDIYVDDEDEEGEKKDGA